MRTLILAAAVLGFANSACAQAYSLEAAMQMRLAQEGHYSGRADGIIGPASRAAMAAYAQAHGIQASNDSIIRHMARTAAERANILNAGIEAGAAEGLRSNLRDPYSAVIEVQNAYQVTTNTIAACGTVNARNAYGAYVGSGTFQVILMPSITGAYPPVFTLMPEDGAEVLCLLGTSLSAVVRQP